MIVLAVGRDISVYSVASFHTILLCSQIFWLLLLLLLLFFFAISATSFTIVHLTLYPIYIETCELPMHMNRTNNKPPLDSAIGIINYYGHTSVLEALPIHTMYCEIHKWICTGDSVLISLEHCGNSRKISTFPMLTTATIAFFYHVSHWTSKKRR